MKKHLTCQDIEVIKYALLNQALGPDGIERPNAEKLYDLFCEAEDIQIILEIEEEDGGEQSALDAMETMISRAERNYGDD